MSNTMAGLVALQVALVLVCLFTLAGKVVRGGSSHELCVHLWCGRKYQALCLLHDAS